MCMSVNKVIENCCESINEFLGARPIEEKIEKNIDDAGVKKFLNNEEVEKVFISDNLALATQFTRRIVKKFTNSFMKLHKSNLYL